MTVLHENIANPEIFFHTKITRIEKAGDDGTVLVHGKCTGDDLDLDDQIIDKEFARDALAKWFNSYANVRQMHSTMLPPGGKGIKLEEKPDGFYLTAKVVEPTAIKLVNEGVYSAYSIGISRPMIVTDPVAKGGRVKGGIVSEVSLVDFPANPTTKFVVANENDDVQKIFKVEKSDTGETVLVDPAPAEIEDEEDVEKVENSDTPIFCDWDECDVCPVEKKKLTSEARNALSDSDFVFPKERKYPIHDENHARAALQRVAEHGTSAEKKKVRAAVKRRYPDIEVSDKNVDSELAKDVNLTEEETPPATESEIKLAGILELMESGQTEAALAKIRESIDAELAVEAATPQTAPILTPVDTASLAEPTPAPMAKIEEADLEKADEEDEDEDGDDTDAEDDDDDDKVETPEVLKLENFGIGLQHRIRQIHDALCPAYSWDAVTAAHPSLSKNGVAHALGPFASSLLFQMLAHELTEDGGTGKGAEGLKHISCAYTDLCSFLDYEEADSATPAIIQSVRDDLHKAFSEYYPNTRVSPLTLDSGDAGRWRRSYLSDGRTPMCGTTTHAKLPARQGDAGDTSASQFDRGAITAGRERPSPASKDLESDLTKYIFYPDQTKEAVRAAMSHVHDHLASSFPEICGIGPHPEFTLAMSAEAMRSQNSTAPVLGLNPAVDLHPEKMPTAGHVRQGTDEVEELDEIPEHGGEGGPAEQASGNVLTGPRKVAETDLNKMTAPDIVKAVASELRKQIGAEITKLGDGLDSLSKRIEDLETAPDPTQAPWRGAVVALNKLLDSDVGKDEAAMSEIDKRAFDERKEKVEYLVRVSNSPDVGMREMARDQLRKIAGMN